MPLKVKLFRKLYYAFVEFGSCSFQLQRIDLLLIVLNVKDYEYKLIHLKNVKPIYSVSCEENSRGQTLERKNCCRKQLLYWPESLTGSTLRLTLVVLLLIGTLIGIVTHLLIVIAIDLAKVLLLFEFLILFFDFIKYC